MSKTVDKKGKFEIVNDDSKKDTKENISNSRTATLAQLFSNATFLDYFLMIIGSIGGIVTGASNPFFNVLFGQILDKLN